MKSKEKLEQEKLARLCQALAEEVDTLSDEELLTDVVEGGEEVDAIAKSVSDIVSSAISEVGSRRLMAARSAYEDEAVKTSALVLNWPLERKRDLMHGFAKNDNEIKKKLTLAARNGEETEADIDSFIEDLLALGAIDEEGNVT